MNIENLDLVSECEELCLAVVWSNNIPLNMKEIMVEVNHRNNKTWKPQTVSTFLTRLRNKGYLDMYRKGRYCYYVPNFTKEAYLRHKLKRDCTVLFGGNYEDMAVLLNTLAQEKKSENNSK